MMNKPLEKAIEIAGGRIALAEKLGMTPMAISQWRGRGVPLSRIVEIEKITNGKVKREEFAPELYAR